MDCQEFKEWLLSRDGCDAVASRKARAHRKDCPPCDRLFIADEGLEQALADGMQTAEVPVGIAQRARALAGEQNEPATLRWPTWFRNSLAPAFAMGLMFMLVIWNPFANPLSSLDAIGNYALANHTQDDLQMAFTVDDTPDPQAWFFERLKFRITLPDLRDHGYDFLGGSECRIGPKKAAYLLYDDHGKRVSVFIIKADDVKLPRDPNRRYRIDAPDHRVDLWQAQGMVCILVQDRPAAPPSTI